jgi:hypothetical protein
MTSGKAHGENREYQVLARNILQTLAGQGLVPYSDDGIDVPFEMGGTTWTLDVALKDSEGNIVVAECKRWQEPIKQGHIAEFAYKVELLREETDKRVAGVFFTRTKYQIGAVKAAPYRGVKVAICNQDQSLQQYTLSFQKYDPTRAKRLQEALAYLTGAIQPKGHLVGRIIHADGTAEDILDLR